MDYKPALFIAGICVVVIALVGFFLPESTRESVSQSSMQFFSPVWRVVGWAQVDTDSVDDSMKSREDLMTELQELRRVNARLETDMALMQGLDEENARLATKLEYKRASRHKLLTARVIHRDPSNWWNTVLINVGSSDEPNLAVDLPVVTPEGVVGKIESVGSHTCRVVLLVDNRCKISSGTESSRARGIVQGSTSMSSGTPTLTFTYVDRDTKFSVGERVYTTGMGRAFPPNLLVGTVTRAPAMQMDKNFGLYREGQVQPSVDLENLKEVFVILAD